MVRNEVSSKPQAVLCPKTVMTSEAAVRPNWNRFEQPAVEEIYGPEILTEVSICFSYGISKSQWQYSSSWWGKVNPVSCLWKQEGYEQQSWSDHIVWSTLLQEAQSNNGLLNTAAEPQRGTAVWWVEAGWVIRGANLDLSRSEPCHLRDPLTLWCSFSSSLYFHYRFFFLIYGSLYFQRLPQRVLSYSQPSL